MGGERNKVFTLAEVSQHNNAKDCWLVIHGKVLLPIALWGFSFFFASVEILVFLSLVEPLEIQLGWF